MERHFTRMRLEIGENYLFELCAPAVNIIHTEKTEEPVRLIPAAEELGLPLSYWYTGSIIQVNDHKRSLIIDIGAGSLEVLLPDAAASKYKKGDIISVEAPTTFILQVHQIPV